MMSCDITPLTDAIRACLQARNEDPFTDGQITAAAVAQIAYAEEQARRERVFAELAGELPGRIADHPLDHVERYAPAIAATMVSARRREQERESALRGVVEEGAGMQLRARRRRNYRGEDAS